MKPRKEHHLEACNDINDKSAREVCNCAAFGITLEQTPPPWVQRGKYITQPKHKRGNTLIVLATCNNEANAEFIVKAVNSYEGAQKLKKEIFVFLKEMKEHAGPLTPLGWEQLNNLIARLETK